MGATWFKHDVDAVYDPKVRKLIRRYGAEGYGRYWALLEALAKDADGLEVASEEDWSTVAEYCLFDFDQIVETQEFVTFLAKIGLLSTVSLRCGKLLSERMSKQVRRAERTSAKRAEAGRKGGSKSPSKTESTSNCQANATDR